MQHHSHTSNHENTKPRVLIVGGGFGGIKAALELCKHKTFDITLLSDQKEFRYYPALYRTATGGLYAESNIALPTILDPKRVTLAAGVAQKIDRKKKTVTTKEGDSYPYDILILAMGVVTNYFGIKGLEEYSYGIKSQEQIRRFKQHLHAQLSESGPDTNYLIVGAGPTGIELAGALPGYLSKIMKNHGVSKKKPKITIIEAAPRLLPRSPESISNAVQHRLTALGVELKLGQTVEGQTADSLMVTGKPITSKTVVWTAGTANHPFFTENKFAIADHGKVAVDEFLQAEPGIYVIGDNANTQYSGLAQTALRDGIFAAHDIVARHKGLKTAPYEPKKPITVIPVGSGWASVEWGRFTFAGLIGWFLRSAADWVGFHDLEPWWKASQQWMTEFGTEEDCPECK